MRRRPCGPSVLLRAADAIDDPDAMRTLVNTTVDLAELQLEMLEIVDSDDATFVPNGN